MTQRRSPLKRHQVPAMQRVIEAAKAQRGHYREIERRSGGVLTYAWITTFVQGRMRDPGFIKVVTLARFCGLNLDWTECVSIANAGDIVQQQAARDLSHSIGKV